MLGDEFLAKRFGSRRSSLRDDARRGRDGDGPGRSRLGRLLAGGIEGGMGLEFGLVRQDGRREELSLLAHIVLRGDQKADTTSPSGTQTSGRKR